MVMPLGNCSIGKKKHLNNQDVLSFISNGFIIFKLFIDCSLAHGSLHIISFYLLIFQIPSVIIQCLYQIFKPSHTSISSFEVSVPQILASSQKIPFKDHHPGTQTQTHSMQAYFFLTSCWETKHIASIAQTQPPCPAAYVKTNDPSACMYNSNRLNK